MSFKLNKNEKYIFATDLDGTFLSEFNHTLHIDSYEAVKKIQAAGHYFVITTGRSWWWTQTMYEQLGSVDALIQFSGAIVHHPHDKNFDEYRASISDDVIKKLIKDIDIWSFSEGVQAVGRKYHATWSKGDDLNKIFFNCYEYIILFKEGSIEESEIINKIENSIGNQYEIRVWNSLGTKGQAAVIISPKGTNKGVALKKIAEYYGVPQKNVIYFGDNKNDIEALIWAGHSYAPSNAIDEAKEAADEILEGTCMDGIVPKKMIELMDGQNENN